MESIRAAFRVKIIPKMPPKEESSSYHLKGARADPFRLPRGWWNYFQLTEAKSFLKGLKVWIMLRLRSLVWKQWKNPKTRVRNLEKLGIAHHDAMLCGNARKKYWHMSKIKWVAIAMPERYFIDKGLYPPGTDF